MEQKLERGAIEIYLSHWYGHVPELAAGVAAVRQDPDSDASEYTDLDAADPEVMHPGGTPCPPRDPTEEGSQPEATEADTMPRPQPDEDGPHDVPDDDVIEKTLPAEPGRERAR